MLSILSHDHTDHGLELAKLTSEEHGDETQALANYFLGKHDSIYGFDKSKTVYSQTTEQSLFTSGEELGQDGGPNKQLNDDLNATPTKDDLWTVTQNQQCFTIQFNSPDIYQQWANIISNEYRLAKINGKQGDIYKLTQLRNKSPTNCTLTLYKTTCRLHVQGPNAGDFMASDFESIAATFNVFNTHIDLIPTDHVSLVQTPIIQDSIPLYSSTPLQKNDTNSDLKKKLDYYKNLCNDLSVENLNLRQEIESLKMETKDVSTQTNQNSPTSQTSTQTDQNSPTSQASTQTFKREYKVASVQTRPIPVPRKPIPAPRPPPKNSHKNNISQVIKDILPKRDEAKQYKHPAKEQNETLFIGTSQIKFIDENRLNSTSVKCMRGAYIIDVDHELSKTDLSQFKNLVIMVGTNNISQGDDQDRMLYEYDHMIEHISNKAPHVSIYVCALTPRIDAKRKHAALKNLNNRLRLMCLKSYQAVFIDNSEFFIKDNVFIDESKLNQNDGYHINRKGTTALLRAINAKIQILHKPNSEVTELHTRRKACFKCGESNHLSAKCHFEQPVKCHWCARLGHKAKYCHLFSPVE